MLELQEAILKIVRRYIVNITPITEAVSAGATEIPVQTSRRYQDCEQVAIYNQDVLDATGEGEVRQITCLPDGNTIRVSEALVDSYTANDSFVQKLVGGRFVQGIYLGDPAKISHYPAITINGRKKENEWFTLESTSETFSIDVSIFTLADDYEQSYRLMHVYAKKIESALFRSLFPLVEPYQTATLAEPVVPTDTVIRINDWESIISGIPGWLWLESWDYTRSNRIKRILSAGVFELTFPVGREFSVGDKIIWPGRHFYNAFPRGIEFGTINQESAVFKAAVISYMAQEEVKRGGPFKDPLDF
jgi:hypothetical protein